MSSLVDELKKDHATILDMLNTAKQLGATTKEGKEKLFSTKTFLLLHLKKEDSNLYPILKQAAAANNQLKQTLDLFAQDMDKISASAFHFFAKHSLEDTGGQFATELGNLMGTLRSRMNREENIIYKAYDELN